jgi:membrane-associated phospholipid phosphatase
MFTHPQFIDQGAPHLHASEWMIVLYLGYLLALLPFRRIPAASRAKLLVLAPVLIALVFVVIAWPPGAVSTTLRTWLPLAYILMCYWLTGFYFVDPQPEYEARFIDFDRRARAWLGAQDFAQSAPRAVLEFLELAYFACYIVLPAGLFAFVIAGQAAAADRFWSIVLLAELLCYGVLPWIRTRPSWVLHPNTPLASRRVLLRRLNLRLVRETSTHANTFPSGHAAGALATALAVAPVWPLAGFVFLLIALSIMAGSVFGEYHYAGDAVTGAATAVLAWGIVTMMAV